MKTGPLLCCAAYAVAQQYTISTFAGGAPQPTPVVAVKASIEPTAGMAADDSGNVYFTSDASVFKVDASGIMTRVAGNSRRGHSGDGGPATSAEIGGAGQVVVDHSGNLYVADAALPNAGAIRKI